MQDNKTSSLINKTMVLSFGNLFSKAIVFISTILFSHWISVSDYGTIDLINTYISLLTPLASLCVYEGTFRFLLDENKFQNQQSVITNSELILLIGAFISSVLFVFVSFFCSWNYFDSFVILLYLIASMLFTFSQYVLRGFSKLVNYAISSIIYASVMILSSIVFLKCFDFGYISLVMGYICGCVIACVYIIKSANIFIYTNRKIIRKKEIASLLRYSLPLMFVGISWWVLSVSDRTVIRLTIGDYYNGIYAAANKIPSILTVLYSAFQYSWTESAIKEMRASDAEKWFNDVFNRMLSVLISFAICLMSLNENIYSYFFSNQYYEASKQMPILLLGVLFMEIGTFFGGIYIAQKKSGEQFQSFFISALINIIINLIFINTFGLYAASISTLIANAFLMLYRYKKTKKYYRWEIDIRNMQLIVVLIISFVVCYLFIDPIIKKLYCLPIFFYVVYHNKNMLIKLFNGYTQKNNYL